MKRTVVIREKMIGSQSAKKKTSKRIIFEAGAPNTTRVSAATIAAGSKAQVVTSISHVVKIGRRVESGAETETGVQKPNRTEESSKEPCATARRG